MSRRILNRTLLVTSLVAATACQIQSVSADTSSPPGGGYEGTQTGTSGATANGSDVTVNAGIQQTQSGAPSAPSAGAASADACTWMVMTNQAAIDSGFMNGLAPASVGNISVSDPTTRGPAAGTDPTTGTWYSVACPVTQSIVSVWVPNNSGGGSAPQAVNTLVVAQQAMAKLHLGAPMIHMSPPTNAEIVNLQDWLWIDPSMWHALAATARVAGVSATATALPFQVTWNMGDGHQVVCNGAGTPYDENVPPDQQHTDCSYVYPNSSAGQPGNHYTVTVTVSWHVSWTATGAPGGGSLGEIAGDVASAPVEVDEVQAVNEPPR